MFRFLDVLQPLSYARLVESSLETGDACQDECKVFLLYGYNKTSRTVERNICERYSFKRCVSIPWHIDTKCNSEKHSPFNWPIRQECHILHYGDTAWDSNFSTVAFPKEWSKAAVTNGKVHSYVWYPAVTHYTLNSSKHWKSLKLQQNFIAKPYILS